MTRLQWLQWSHMKEGRTHCKCHVFHGYSANRATRTMLKDESPLAHKGPCEGPEVPVKDDHPLGRKEAPQKGTKLEGFRMTKK